MGQGEGKRQNPTWSDLSHHRDHYPFKPGGIPGLGPATRGGGRARSLYATPPSPPPPPPPGFER